MSVSSRPPRQVTITRRQGGTTHPQLRGLSASVGDAVDADPGRGHGVASEAGLDQLASPDQALQRRRHLGLRQPRHQDVPGKNGGQGFLVEQVCGRPDGRYPQVAGRWWRASGRVGDRGTTSGPRPQPPSAPASPPTWPDCRTFGTTAGPEDHPHRGDQRSAGRSRPAGIHAWTRAVCPPASMAYTTRADHPPRSLSSRPPGGPSPPAGVPVSTRRAMPGLGSGVRYHTRRDVRGGQPSIPALCANARLPIIIKNDVCHRRGPGLASLPPARRRRVWLAGAAACAMLLAVTGVAAPADAATPVAPPAASPLQSRADAVVAAGVVGYVARVDTGPRVTTAVAGLADRATGRRLGPDDQFEIGSNTKTFMATLTLQLVADGKLSLTDTVEQHLPGLVPNGDKITLKMLLQHTSGLSDYTDEAFMETVLADPTRVWTPEELVAIATKHQPTFAPGTSWAYSNTNYILVGMILRKVTGTSPAHLVQQRIARRLGLHRTYLPTTTAKHTGPGYAHGYLATPDGTTFQYTDVSGWALGGWAGTAGAMISTPSELSRFFSALLGGKLLPAAQLTQMRTLVPFPAGYGATGGYGLGLQRVDTPCGPAWGHGGGSSGTSAPPCSPRTAAAPPSRMRPLCSTPGPPRTPRSTRPSRPPSPRTRPPSARCSASRCPPPRHRRTDHNPRGFVPELVPEPSAGAGFRD